MPKYTVHIKRVVTLMVEVEADSPEDADQKVWDVIDDSDISETDETIEEISDERGRCYVQDRRGVYRPH